MIRQISLFILILLLSTPLLQAQEDEEEDDDAWKVETPHGPYDEVSFTVTKGTWMNLDVSPDGQEIVFDLLGDIYSLPIDGGEATLLLGGLPYEVQPRFSPDGKHISFTSDRGGGDNIWVMDREGKNLRQVTKESFRLLNNAVWTPDGKYIVARKHFTSTRSLGAGEMWMYHVDSGGAGMQLTKRKNDQQDAGEPCISPDGRYIYFSEDVSPGGYFQYNKDPNGQIYVVQRYDRETGQVERVAAGAGGACRPQVSPDGKKLAFVRRVRTRSVLFIQDLESGEEWPLYDSLSRDQQETWAIFGVYPNFNWMPDGKHIIIYGLGTFVKVNAKTGEGTIIPFEAECNHIIEWAVKSKQTIASESFEAKMLRHAVTSPNGKYLVFNAAGHLYIKELPAGKPRRLTSDDRHEFYPSFSPDSRRIVYVAWGDEEHGAICSISTSSVGSKGRKLTSKKGFYHSPSFSQDGRKIVFVKGGGNNVLGYTYGKEPGLYTMSSSGGEMMKVYHTGSEPVFSKDGKKIYFLEWAGGQKHYNALDIETKKVRTLFKSKYGKQFTPSPDGEWLAFTELFNVYIVPFPKVGGTVDLSAQTKALPVKKVSKDAGTSLHWSGDNTKLHWLLGSRYYSTELKDLYSFMRSDGEKPTPDTVGIRIGLYLDTDIPKGQFLFSNARIITMKGDEVIEEGYVWVEDNKIKQIGEGKAPNPTGVEVIDCKGKTIMPGLVDVHAHLGASYNGISPQQQWSYFANLAYGVTTTHDPSISTEMVFSQSEMVESGEMIGPRIFSTGTILYGADGDFKAVINSYDDALSHLRRLKAVGAFSVKSYNQPRREQRQQVIKAARELKMMVYPEGGSTFLHNMTMIVDGHTGVEHSIPVYPVYEDVVKLWGNSKTGYTPTLIVGYGGLWGENYWYQKTNVWEKERLLKYTPRPIIDSRSRRRTKVPDTEFGHIQNSQGAKAILDGGAKVQLGAHGQLQGLGVHWELWMLQQGGMTNMEALRCATQWGADYIGMGHAIGSLEKGKLADLIILDKNPLEDILHTEFVRYVMKNGRLYDPETMNEIGGDGQKRKKFYWEQYKNSNNFIWNDACQSFELPKCSCVRGHTH